jgi:hypothetical protein
MNEWNPQAHESFLQAIEYDSAEQRRVHLGNDCGENAGLRAEVESLLEGRAQVGGFLERPLVRLAPAALQETSNRSASTRSRKPSAGGNGHRAEGIRPQAEPCRRGEDHRLRVRPGGGRRACDQARRRHRGSRNTCLRNRGGANPRITGPTRSAWAACFTRCVWAQACDHSVLKSDRPVVNMKP